MSWKWCDKSRRDEIGATHFPFSEIEKNSQILSEWFEIQQDERHSPYLTHEFFSYFYKSRVLYKRPDESDLFLTYKNDPLHQRHVSIKKNFNEK